VSDAAAIAERVRAFVRDVVIPAEPRDEGSEHGPAAELRAELQTAARAAGLFAPHVGTAFGGLGLDVRAQAVVFEEAGYSLLGPLALNCSAPDEGNMHLLEAVASAEQKERYLRPLAAGDVRSAFAMTEPAPGAGSDPTMLLTTARRDGGNWVINGHKHLITGAQGCAFYICMARTAEEIRHDEGATMLLVPADNPGVRVERLIPTMDRAFSGGHAVVTFDDCRVPADAVLGEAGLGYRYAQVRLAPARLTHCMRWLGLARRALDIALDRAGQRWAFGEPLLEQGMVQGMVADSVIDIEASRGLIRTCAEVLDAGGRGAHESSVAKVFVSEAVGRAVDRSLQICGGLGASDDLPLARYAREVRAFRIYDGPSETHRWSIARRAARRRQREQ
jgi:acyl-CoA dehydrogenase